MMTIFIKRLKSLFIRANIIIVLAFVIILISLFSLNKTQETAFGNHRLRVVASVKNGFIQKYYAEINTKIWEVKLSDKKIKNLGLGYEYEVYGSLNYYQRQNIEETEIESLKQAQKENYATSSAVVGLVDIIDLSKKYTCDFQCQTIVQIDVLRQFAKNQIQNSTCNLYAYDWSSISPFASCTDISALLQGLLLGGNQSFSKEMQQNFRTTGITHIVAISGFNISLIVSIVQIVLDKIKISFKIQFIFIVIFLALFVALVGPSPSVIRAALMGIIMLMARFFGRSCSGLRALVLASIIMLLYNPFYIFSISFQLSFLATFGLMSFFDLTDVLNFKWVEIIKETAWATIVANLYTLPVLINTFGYFSPLSIIPNLIILPLIPFTMLIELLIFVPFIGNYLGIFAGLICAWILGLVEWLSSWLPLIYLEKLEIWEVGFWYIGLVGIAFWVRNRKQNVNLV